MKYEQKLYTVHTDHLENKKVKQQNRFKKYEYGYNVDLDCVIISRDGTIGEIYQVQGLRIGLPKAPKEVDGMRLRRQEQVFLQVPRPSTLDKLKTIHDFNILPEDIKEKYVGYINSQFDRRSDGYWFMCNAVPTYITGTHYMYLNWTKIDIGAPDFRQANRIFYYFWEACKADKRSYGMCYLKNRRSGFSFMASCESVNLATITTDARFGILSKTGADAKKMFTDKVVPISLNYPFFFKPIQDGQEKPKTEISYAVPTKKLTRKSLSATSKDEFDGKGLETSIDWKNTGDNSYDGEKLRLLVHDESGKWERPNNILNNWLVTKTCLRLGKKIVGKCMMGSTSNALDKGGDNFKKLYYDSDLSTIKRNRNGQTPSGLYSLFIPMEWGYEGFIDSYGFPVFDTPEEPIPGIDGEAIDVGVVEHWENEVEGLKHNADGLNEYYRQFPRSEKHAFRDEAVNSLFNLTRIYDQIDFVESLKGDGHVNIGSFKWKDGRKDTEVEFYPHAHGRFKLSWIPPAYMQNLKKWKDGICYPGNDTGAFGCDSYDISGTVDGGGSNGALHGVTGFNMVPSVPSNTFFLEYVARPQTADIFFEEVLMAMVFYGMPILCENNKPRLLYYLKRRGYRGYSMNRPDKTWTNLSKTEKEVGGIPNSSEDIKQAHAAAIETFIEANVGFDEEGQLSKRVMFHTTLEDWARFDITDRTKFDASISSGLALMATHKYRYSPRTERQTKTIDIGFSRYNNEESRSKILKF